MIINLWSESSFFEKFRLVMFMIAMFLLTLAYLFPNAFITATPLSLIAQCEKYNAVYTGKFLVINGEAVPICDQQ